MVKIAVFPGSFDPFTIGHESIVRRAEALFDKIVVAIGKNMSKTHLFTPEQRQAMIEDLFKDSPKVEVQTYSGLTTDFCRSIGAKYMLRGLRTSTDFEYEKTLAQVNQAVLPEVESIFMLTLPEHAAINSSVVREIMFYGGDVSKFLPKGMDVSKYIEPKV